MRFNRGTLLKGEFGPSSEPSPFFDVLVVVVFFFLPIPTVIPRICSHVPIKGGGGSYISNRGAPRPSCFICSVLLVLLPNLGAPLPVIFLIASIANDIPKLAKIVPKPLPCCVVLFGFI